MGKKHSLFLYVYVLLYCLACGLSLPFDGAVAWIKSNFCDSWTPDRHSHHGRFPSFHVQSGLTIWLLIQCQCKWAEVWTYSPALIISRCLFLGPLLCGSHMFMLHTLAICGWEWEDKVLLGGEMALSLWIKPCMLRSYEMDKYRSANCCNVGEKKKWQECQCFLNHK